MKTIIIAEDIIPVAEFKVGISKFLKLLRTDGRPKIITQNGKPAGVLLSPQEYDNLVYHKEFTASVERGNDDATSQQTMTTEALKAGIKRRRE